MIFCMLNTEKIGMKLSQICPPHLSYVATLPCEIQITLHYKLQYIKT